MNLKIWTHQVQFINVQLNKHCCTMNEYIHDKRTINIHKGLWKWNLQIGMIPKCLSIFAHEDIEEKKLYNQLINQIYPLNFIIGVNIKSTTQVTWPKYITFIDTFTNRNFTFLIFMACLQKSESIKY